MNSLSGAFSMQMQPSHPRGGKGPRCRSRRRVETRLSAVTFLMTGILTPNGPKVKKSSTHWNPVDNVTGASVCQSATIASLERQPAMIVANEVDVLETGGALSVHESSIKLSRKTFRMHIDSIYSDKIGAPVRELPANAFDSHKRAKQDQPFFVHCPTVIDPRFYVRDRGIGMTQDTMQNVYIVLGESDKEETDEEVGMWGLGSKSPFAYADQYNITCYDGVEARHYGYGINERGVPTLYLMSIEPCTEPRGVQVGFAVESKDFDAFKAAIEKVAIAHGNAFESNIPLKPMGEVVFEGQDWQAYKNSHELLGRAQHWFARQGCVLYPIEAQQVSTPNDYQSKLTYIIDCPIGTIKMTPSREAIEYKPEVVEYLKGRVEALVTEVKNAVWESVKGIDSVIDFFATIEKIKPNFVSGPFEHPLTGLTSPDLKPQWPTLFFEAKFSAASRWEFSTPSSLALSTVKRTRIYLLDDVSPLLDPSRDPSGTVGLSKSEVRRISRFTRSYLEEHKETDALFLMNSAWTPEFRAACLPHVEFVEITFDSLRDAVPKRVAPPKIDAKPPIRGLALAKSAGDQKPVFEIKGDEKNVAWVSSEQYRRQSSALFKIGQRFEITSLYIAAPDAQKLMSEAGVVHLRDAIDRGLAKNDLSFADWYFAKDKLSSYQIKAFVEFLRLLAKLAPDSYDKLAAAKGEFSTIALGVRRLLKATEVAPLADEEKKALDSLIIDDAGRAVTPPVPADLVGFEAAMKVISDNGYSNPTCKFVQAIITVKDVAQLKRTSQALIAIQKLIPPSEKFKG